MTNLESTTLGSSPGLLPIEEDCDLDNPSTQAVSSRDVATLPTLSALSQTDLFGSVLSDSPASSPRKSTKASRVLSQLNRSSKALVIGDCNLGEFEDSETTVIADKEGRLSLFKQALLQYSDEPLTSLKVFILCMSSSDTSNLPNTNFVTLRALMTAAKKAFPNARLAVSLIGHTPNLSDSDLDDMTSFNSLVKERLSSGCTILGPPADFIMKNGVWATSTKMCMFEILHNFLAL